MVTIRVAVSLSKTRAVFLQQNLTRLILQQTFFQWRSKGRSSSLKISSYSLCFTEAFMCENWTLDYYSWHRFQTTKHQFLRHTPFPKTERITDEGSIRFLRSQGFLWAWDRKNEYPSCFVTLNCRDSKPRSESIPGMSNKKSFKTKKTL